MRLRLVLLLALSLGATAIFLSTARATPPEPVQITIDETFNTTVPFVTGDITATGGIFGTKAEGTLESIGFKPVGFPGKGTPYPFPDHLFVYTAYDKYTFDSGVFWIEFEASCNVTWNFETGDSVASCAGNWRVNGGTGDYARLKGTGKFDETQMLDAFGSGTGDITLTGAMHID